MLLIGGWRATMLLMETEELLAMIVAGVPKVAQAIAAIPDEQRPRALAAAERSYLQTARDFGYGEETARNLVTVLMRFLRAEVERTIGETEAA
jgi:hypothetical protein